MEEEKQVRQFLSLEMGPSGFILGTARTGRIRRRNMMMIKVVMITMINTNIDKQSNCKVFPAHAKKQQRGSRGIAPLILKVGAR